MRSNPMSARRAGQRSHSMQAGYAFLCKGRRFQVVEQELV